FLEKDAIIVIEEHNEALDTIYRQAEATEEYNIVRHNKALEFVSENTLCIIVDTNRPHLTECPEILDICKQKVVIDHHRLADDSIATPTIAYIESYASSASELITEVLQYFSQKRFINKFEAEALLAGIMVDTNNYSSRSGVRTFEAAAWLKRAGADTAEVKRFFRTDIQSFKARATAIANAEYTPDKIAFARNDCYSDEAAIINAQVADELITVKGVQAAFVIGMDNKMKTLVSARSLGDINVQAMMETLGGGGHYTAAAAQLSISPDEAREEIDKMIRKLMDTSADKEEN
ncbi:MAG: DHH family phosphoesterase, partial [Clostridiales bacterium]|nr:DHH family phosphoesterase [Clostridiales bacterium]